MFFLVFFYYCIFLVGITFILLDDNLNEKRTLFNDESDDDDNDEPKDNDKPKDNDEPKDNAYATNKNQDTSKYEDRYKINTESVDDELSPEKLEALGNCFILEHTPNGNALILYNYKSDSFVYYSDNSIPYKYLNALARKYVNTYRCKKLYITSVSASDAETTKETKETIEEKPSIEEKPAKKQIFAKFKGYNKNTSNKIQSRTQQPQQHQQKHSNTLQVDVVANRYTYQGKIANFNFLKKPDKKLVNKKLALSFADYKKLNI